MNPVHGNKPAPKPPTPKSSSLSLPSLPVPSRPLPPAPPETAPVSVLVVDDHHVVRVGLCAVLREHSGLRVVGDASTAAEATAKCDELRPDVVLMDIRMPGGSGIEACRWIKERHPTTRIIFLTSYSDSDTLVEALSAGADGYVLKAVNGQDIAEAVEKVARGEAIVDPGVTRQLIQLAAGKSPKPSTAPPSATPTMTDRENRLLELVHAGHTNKEIASTLNLSEKTVRNLLSGVFGKLGATTRQEAAQRWSASRPP